MASLTASETRDRPIMMRPILEARNIREPLHITESGGRRQRERILPGRPVIGISRINKSRSDTTSQGPRRPAENFDLFAQRLQAANSQRLSASKRAASMVQQPGNGRFEFPYLFDKDPDHGSKNNILAADSLSIKPVNSGTVNIADAIAKAKAIDAEKGVSYKRPPPSYGAQDPRLAGGRPYRTSRSRSRSLPARRDAYRDNANPYRDERRGERGPVARDYRERSFSPGPRGRVPPGVFPPTYGRGYATRDRSPPRGADDNVESVSIESNLVGLIIGRQGENLRGVEAETGCRVQFITGPDETGPYRQCKLTGTPVARAQAKAEINRIIDDSGMAANARAAAERPRDGPPGRATSHQLALRDGDDSMQIMVPDRTVGLIIGRGGETIRDLQERSGCHVDIVGEQKSVNGLRPVNLTGPREAAARARDLIMEIVESDSKSQAGKDRALAQREPARDASHSNGYGGGGAAGDKDSVFVPSETVNMIIGKGGETIMDMQSTTGCKINVSPSSGPEEVEREIGLVGSRDAIAAAKRAIEDKVEKVVSYLSRMIWLNTDFSTASEEWRWRRRR